MEAAGIRACDAYTSVQRYADRIAEELDEVTAPINVQTADLDEEDSMVVAVAEVITLHGPKS